MCVQYVRIGDNTARYYPVFLANAEPEDKLYYLAAVVEMRAASIGSMKRLLCTIILRLERERERERERETQTETETERRGHLKAQRCFE